MQKKRSKSTVVILAFFMLYGCFAALAQETYYMFSTLSGTEKGWEDGPLKSAKFWTPEGIAVDTKNNVYVTEYWNNTVRKISPDGVVTTLAGKSNEIGAVDGQGSEARFNRPHGIDVASEGSVFVCDMKSNTIRKIGTDGIVSTVAGLAGIEGSSDGNPQEATFNKPEDIAVNSKGVLYVVDTYNFTVREISTDGVVKTFAGMAGETGSRDGMGNQARFNMPIGIAIDGKDNIYVVDANYDESDNGNCTIRKISPEGEVTTIAGKAGISGTVDGPGKEARFNRPVGIAASKDGTLFIADTEADLIRKIDTFGNVSTLGGTYLLEEFADGQSWEARFADPQAIAVDDNGVIYIADTFNHSIRKGTLKQKKPIKVFMLAGQSNMGGKGDGSLLSQEDKNGLQTAKNNILFAYNRQYFGPLELTDASAYDSENYDLEKTFGPEIFFGIEMAKAFPEDQFLFIKRSLDGTSLYGNWNPEWIEAKATVMGEQNGPKLYADFQKYIKEVLSGYDPSEYEFAGMLWVQGEADSKVPAAAEAYGQNLQHLIKGMRDFTKKPELPFIIFQVGSGEVIKGMQETSKKLENVVLIPQSDNPASLDYYPEYAPPKSHYTYKGMKKIGERFAIEHLKMSDK